MLRGNCQISQREEVVAAEETSDRAREEKRVEGLLGLPQGHYAALLSVRFAGKQSHGSGA